MTVTWAHHDSDFDAATPAVRKDAIVRHYDTEIVAWSPISSRPAYLDPLGALVFQLLDGSASVAELISDVHAVVGVPRGIARDQIRKVVTRLEGAQLLTAQDPRDDHEELDAEPGPFPGPPNP